MHSGCADETMDQRTVPVNAFAQQRCSFVFGRHDRTESLEDMKFFGKCQSNARTIACERSSEWDSRRGGGIPLDADCSL